MKEIPDFPTEVTFKAICRNKPFLLDTIKNLISEKNIQCTITGKESEKGNFISYTVTAIFPSEEILQAVCSSITSLDDVFTIF